jgi:hypothetical protein
MWVYIETNLQESFFEKGDRKRAVVDADPHELCGITANIPIFDSLLHQCCQLYSNLNEDNLTASIHSLNSP